MTIDDLASIVHSPRHVGRLPVGSKVVVSDGQGHIREVTGWWATDDVFVLGVAPDQAAPGLSNAPGSWRWEQRGDKWWHIHDELMIEDGPHDAPTEWPT